MPGGNTLETIQRESTPEIRLEASGRPILPAGLLTSAAVAVTVLSWASAFAGTRFALQAYTPVYVALARFLVASLALALYAALSRMPLPRLRDLPGLALTGIAGISFYSVALSYGQVTIPAGTSSLLIASSPVWMALLARTLFGERLRWRGWAGIAVSFVGVAVIALGTQAGFQIDLRALVVLAAAVASALYSLGQKPYLARYSALQCTTYAIWFGTLFLLPFGPDIATVVANAPIAATAAVIYMGIFPCALGYVTWAYVLARVPASTAGSFLYLVPAFAILIAWVCLGEVPTILSLAGGSLVLAGVIAVNLWGRQPRRAGNES